MAGKTNVVSHRVDVVRVQTGIQWDESAMPSAETELRLRLKLLV